MKTIRHKILLFLILLAIGNRAMAQSDSKLVCTALVKKDSVVLRWVPASIPVWQVGIKYGYVIKRYTISKGGVFIPDGLSKGEILTPIPIKPFGREIFEKLTLQDPRAAVVEEAIYGTEFQPLQGSDNFAGFMKAYNNLEVRFGFALFICDLSSVISRAAGLRFTDRNVVPDERYAYSISLANIPDGMQVDPAIVVLDAGIVTKLPAVTEVQAVFLDKTVKLQWPISLYKGTYTAYILEKSTDGSSFATVSDLPLVNITENDDPDYFFYTDSLISNNKQTSYRVKGISSFGEEGPVSEIVTGKGAPKFTAYAVIDTAEVIDNKKIIVRWRVTESESAPVKSISILRSDKYDGVFENISAKAMAPDTRIYTDARPKLSNYYKIILTGKNNITSSSFPYFVQTEDNDPPLPPKMLTGSVDSTGIVTIAWKENTEPDLLGYKVFRANSPDEEFISLNREISPKNVCNDTINLNTFTQKICYQVVALDKRYNSSDYSAVLSLSRPDTISPAPAIIYRIDINNGKATLHFESSPSSDVVQYELFRIQEKDSINDKLKTWKGNLPDTYEDIPEDQGKSYYYKISTIDFSGNSSKFERIVYFPVTAKKTIKLRAEQAGNGRSVLLSWDVPEGLKPVKTILYRSTGSAPFSICSTIEGTAQMVIDTDIEINFAYKYMIKLIGESGNGIVSGQISISASSFSDTKKN
jgi:uncharacterized protein